MNTIMTSGEMVETALHDLSSLIGINSLPAPKTVMLWTGGLDDQATVTEIGVAILLRDVRGLTRWADALDVTVQAADHGWSKAETVHRGVRVRLSAYDRSGA